jgi:hypothetical protein
MKQKKNLLNYILIIQYLIVVLAKKSLEMLVILLSQVITKILVHISTIITLVNNNLFV